MLKRLSMIACVIPAAALAQPPAPPAWNPPPPRQCTLSAQQIEAGRQMALAFFRPGVTPAERAGMLDPSYVQHNPRFKKYAQDNNLSDADAFPKMLAELLATGQLGGPPPGPPGAPRPPAGNPLVLVMTDCDLTTIVRSVYQQVPGAAPGTWFEAFNFDTFKVRNGKFIEHWDQQLIPPPRPAGGPGMPPPPPGAMPPPRP